MFTYELEIRSLSELWYVLFRKKRCPRCGGELYRVGVLPKFSSGWEQDGLNFEYAHKAKEAPRYRCDSCHAYFSLAQLANEA